MSIKLYRSNYDEFDPTKNGGDITDIEIESGVLHSFIPRIRTRTAEAGGERWFKFFVKTDVDIVSIGIDVAKYTTSPSEEVYFALETKSDHTDYESDLNKDNLKITADRNVSDFVKADDWITFYDSDINRVTSMQVDSVDNDTITFKQWSDKAIFENYTASSSILVDSLNANEYIGVWIKQVVGAYTEAMENPANEFVFNCWYDIK